MGIFSNSGQFSLFKKTTEPLFKVPKSVQRTIPVYRISKSGIFEIEKKKGKHLFDRLYELVDFGYAVQNANEQENTIKNYCALLNIFNFSIKIITINHNKDMQELRKQVLIENSEDPMIKDFNEIIMDRIVEGKNGIEQAKYLVVTVEKETYEDAAAFFNTLETDMLVCLEQIGSTIIPLDWKARLKTLHYIYRLGEESKFQDLGWDDLLKQHRNWKSDICSVGIKEYKDHFEMGNKHCCVLFARKYPSNLKDTFISEISNVPFHTIVTLDISPIPDNIARDKLKEVYLFIEKNIEKQQELRNKNNMFSTDISYDKRKEKGEIEDCMDAINDNDESMYFMGLYITIIADSAEELKSNISNILSIGESHALNIEVHNWNQLPAFNTSLPVGGRYVKTMRSFLTQSMGSLIPFYAQELQDKSPEALYYGTNQLSKNLIILDRKSLPNGNGFILSITGGGKGVHVKEEIIQVTIHTPDDVILIDPQNEYFELVQERGGQIINISLGTDNHINPLQIPDIESILNGNKSMSAFIAEKTEFMLSLCEQVTEHAITPGQKTIVDQCVRELYENMIKEYKSGKPAVSPTIKDFQNIVKEKDIPLAQDLALSLGLFTEGSLSIFSHENNVDMGNRLICFGIQELGENLKPLAMLVMLEAIKNKIEANSKIGRATRLYIDEFHGARRSVA